jgi:CDGSH-type Zn-finger protein
MSDSAEATPQPTITVRPNGSLRVTGATLIGADGNVITERESYSLCRCGHSKDKPFCDGAHRECGFDDAGTHQIVE